MTEIEDESKRQEKPRCEHDWKAVGEAYMKTHIELVCTKCGEKKEIEQFPF